MGRITGNAAHNTTRNKTEHFPPAFSYFFLQSLVLEVGDELLTRIHLEKAGCNVDSNTGSREGRHF